MGMWGDGSVWIVGFSPWIGQGIALFPYPTHKEGRAVVKLLTVLRLERGYPAPGSRAAQNELRVKSCELR